MKIKISHIKKKVNKINLFHLSVSLGLGLVLLYVFLVLSNFDFPISSENQIMKWQYKLLSSDVSLNTPLPNDLLLINIGYDRAIEKIYDSDGLLMGNIDITDRQKLIELLDMAQSVGDYKFIILDVRFTDEVKTNVDSKLWSALVSTPRLVLPSHNGMSVADESLTHLTANADYAITILENDFVKYPILSENKFSMAWAAYISQKPNSVHQFAGLAFSEAHLMRRSIIPNIHVLANDIYDTNGDKKIYNLGEDLLTDSDHMKDLLSDKFIIVGDFTNQDIHSTYRGIIHGPMLHVNVLYNLLMRDHLMSWTTLIVLWMLFSMSFAIVLYQPNFIQKLRKPLLIFNLIKSSKYKKFFSDLYQVLISFIGFGTLYVIVFLLIFKTTNQIYEILIFSSFFTILSSILNINNQTE